MRTLVLLLLISTGGCALHQTAARSYTQYAYAVIQQDADEAEDQDIALALYLQDRARRLYRSGSNSAASRARRSRVRSAPTSRCSTGPARPGAR